jgi:hypothetical protein
LLRHPPSKCIAFISYSGVLKENKSRFMDMRQFRFNGRVLSDWEIQQATILISEPTAKSKGGLLGHGNSLHPHALERMKERGATEDEVEATVTKGTFVQNVHKTAKNLGWAAVRGLWSVVRFGFFNSPPQYHLPELPRLNRASPFNWAGGVN